MAPRKPKPQPLATSNLEAAHLTISSLRSLGKLGEVDAVRVATLLGLAEAVDRAPDNASLWREYRAAEAALHEVREMESDDALAITAALSAPVGHAKNTRATHTRRASGGGSR